MLPALRSPSTGGQGNENKLSYFPVCRQAGLGNNENSLYRNDRLFFCE